MDLWGCLGPPLRLLRYYPVTSIPDKWEFGNYRFVSILNGAHTCMRTLVLQQVVLFRPLVAGALFCNFFWQFPDLPLSLA